MVNIQKVKDHFDNDRETIAEVIEIFVESSQESLKGIEESLASSNYKDLYIHAHTFKGMVLNFFDDEVSDKAKKLEFMGKNSAIEENSAQLLSELKHDCIVIINALKSEFNI